MQEIINILQIFICTWTIIVIIAMFIAIIFILSMKELRNDVELEEFIEGTILEPIIFAISIFISGCIITVQTLLY